MESAIDRKYEWLSKAKRDFVRKIERQGKFQVNVSKHTSTIDIRRKHPVTRHTIKGLIIYPDGTAIDATLDLSVARIIRSVKDWEKVLK
jgi:hypothetical protein